MNNMNESQLMKEFNDREHEKELQEKMKFLDREENFRRELLESKLKSIDKLSESVSSLVSALVNQKSGPTINIYIDSSTNPENMKDLMKQVNETFIK